MQDLSPDNSSTESISSSSAGTSSTTTFNTMQGSEWWELAKNPTP